MAASISYSSHPDVDPSTLLGPVEDTTDIWVSMRTGIKDAENAQNYDPVILFHPKSGRFARPVSTPKAYGHLMFPKEENRVSINAVQSEHDTTESLGAFTPFETDNSRYNYAAMRDGFTGPVLDLENHYEGSHYNSATMTFTFGRQRHNCQMWQTYCHHSRGTISSFTSMRMSSTVIVKQSHY
ncbi:hypothetical protein V7S43_010420 [Phytophthora oleae]|uniref:Apiosidase-like catalytic domain-containing protein n=1 Tax=Phytophthora oleae TaxID=2107226 RepID=A0ABD3FE34_9STRA